MEEFLFGGADLPDLLIISSEMGGMETLVPLCLFTELQPESGDTVDGAESEHVSGPGSRQHPICGIVRWIPRMAIPRNIHHRCYLL
jgi:hypothetical protein